MKGYTVGNLIVLIFAAGIIFLHGCRKDEVPLVTTSEVTEITGTTALAGGKVTDEGSGPVTKRGVCWSESPQPVITDNYTSEGNGSGTFTSLLSDLDPATKYHIRAYATNNAGTGYGEVILFTTGGNAPGSAAGRPVSLKSNSVILNGSVNANNLATTVVFEYGPTTDYGQTAEPEAGEVTGTGFTDVSAFVTGLIPATEYHFRVKATNSLGTVYSDDMTFTTMNPVPSSGLVAWYPYNGNANDESGNGLDGIINGAVPTTDRMDSANSAFYFDGTDDYIKVLSANLLNLQTFTIAAWVYVERFGGLQESAGMILSRGIFPDFNYQLNAGTYCACGSSFNVSATISGINRSLYATSSYAINRRYFVAATNDGSSLRLYIDSVPAGELTSGVPEDNSNDLYIGKYESDMLWNFKGKIDDIRIYDLALDESEILQLYNEIPE